VMNCTTMGNPTSATCGNLSPPQTSLPMYLTGIGMGNVGANGGSGSVVLVY
jgi:hypothetical protein